MDADAYLRKHGWRGSGAALGQSGAGLAKPLLISQKQNKLGLGATTSATQWDTWWSSSLDSRLQKLQVVSAATTPAAIPTPPSTPSTAEEVDKSLPGPRGKKRLYGGFLKGAGLQGTGVLALDAGTGTADVEPVPQAPETALANEDATSQSKADRKAERRRKRLETGSRLASKTPSVSKRKSNGKRSRSIGDFKQRKRSKRKDGPAEG